MIYIALLDKEFENTIDLERYLNNCRIEYMEQVTRQYDLSKEDSLSIYSCLRIKDEIKNKKNFL